MTRVAAWKRGDPTLWRVVEEWLDGGPGAEEFVSNERRQVVRLATEQPAGILVKRFLPRPGVQRWVNAGRRYALQSPGRKEWRALSRLRSVGLNVPEPLALARLRDGGELLVLSFIAGRRLMDALADSRSERHRLLTAVGDQVALLHATGLVHRDLHTGNFLVDEEGRPALFDFQRVRRTRGTRTRRRDLAALDFSFAQARLSIADRMRFRRAALGISKRPSPSERRSLRGVGEESSRVASRHFRSRTKRCLRPGRLYARIEIEGRSGLRLRSVPSDVIAEALAIHRAAQAGEGALCARGEILKRDHRSRVTAARVAGRALVVKEVVKQGRARLLADSLRGSPARRAWRGGHGLLARGIRAATPLAFVEQKRLWLPLASIVVLEDVRPATPAHEFEGAGQHAELALALRRLVVTLHARGVIHGDFQAPHIYLSEGPIGQRSEGSLGLHCALIDLEGVRFPRRLSNDRRIQSLAELNASIPDQLLPAEERRKAFELYAQRLPFGEDNAAQSERLAAEAEIVRRSLARAHLWKGEDCREALTQSPARRDRR